MTNFSLFSNSVKATIYISPQGIIYIVAMRITKIASLKKWHSDFERKRWLAGKRKITNYYGYLDSLLWVYCVSQDDRQQAGLSVTLKKHFMLDTFHELACLNKLYEDKLIEKLPSGTVVATLNGIVFHKRGGFKGQRLRQKIDTIYKIAIPTLATIATVGILILEIQKYHSDCLCK